MAIFEPNSATTLSLRYSPGEYKRLLNTQSESIFTFGDFRLQRSSESDIMTGTSYNVQFDGFSTLESLGAEGLATDITYYVKPSELKNPSNDPSTYAYFSSFYTEIAAAISNIIDTFPYAALVYDNGVGITIYDYVATYDNSGLTWYSEFKIPLSAITNQGVLAFNSGSSVTNMSLMTDYDEFEIQMSGQTSLSASNESFEIVGYNLSASTITYLHFRIQGMFEQVSGTTSVLPLYIRPSVSRLNEYKRNVSKLEKHLLDDGAFYVPDLKLDDGTLYRIVYTWPKTIDGFNPDISGDDFENYKESLLNIAQEIDNYKTNIFLRTLIPETYIENDSDSEVLKTIIQTYAHEFDNLKRYIDAIAYAHSISYDGEENVPDKFLHKLSHLLGWRLSDTFSEVDLFEYLVGENNDEENSFSYYNLEIWKRILVNLVWLYKKKGTRDALNFIFRLLGAPECLIVLDEFIYKINQATVNVNNDKINSYGFINYDASNYIFQEGGSGRGSGQAYITQWMPEFDPLKFVDNTKVYVADETYGTQSMVNTKEINLGFDPAKAVECDVFDFYQESACTCFDMSLSATCYLFSSITLPEEYWVYNCDDVQPDSISAMTLDQYLDYVYTHVVEPTGRKTNHQDHRCWFYPELKKVYLNYYYLNNPESNQLTIKKLESYLNLIEKSLGDYVIQLLPATTIFNQIGTTYRNPLFLRQKFVYRKGVNDGSEFQVGLPVNLSENPGAIHSTTCEIVPILEAENNVVSVQGTFTEQLSPEINIVSISSRINSCISCSVSTLSVDSIVNENSFYNNIPGVSVTCEVEPPVTDIFKIYQTSKF